MNRRKAWTEDDLTAALIHCVDCEHATSFSRTCAAYSFQNGIGAKRDVKKDPHKKASLGLPTQKMELKASGGGAVQRFLAGLVAGEVSKVKLLQPRYVKASSVPMTKGELWCVKRALMTALRSVELIDYVDIPLLAKIIGRTEWFTNKAVQAIKIRQSVKVKNVIKES